METRADRQIDLRQVVSETRNEIEALAERGAVGLRVEVPPQSLIVQGDSESLERVLLILVDNAVKYSRPGGEVRLQLSVAPSVPDERPAALVEVSDDGIGLDPVEMERLFERFYRRAQARQQSPDGSGLGLAIARTIVERNHGSITTRGNRRKRARLSGASTAATRSSGTSVGTRTRERDEEVAGQGRGNESPHRRCEGTA